LQLLELLDPIFDLALQLVIDLNFQFTKNQKTTECTYDLILAIFRAIEMVGQYDLSDHYIAIINELYHFMHLL